MCRKTLCQKQFLFVASCPARSWYGLPNKISILYTVCEMMCRPVRTACTCCSLCQPAAPVWSSHRLSCPFLSQGCKSGPGWQISASDREENTPTVATEASRAQGQRGCALKRLPTCLQLGVPRTCGTRTRRGCFIDHGARDACWPIVDVTRTGTTLPEVSDGHRLTSRSL